MILIKDTFYSFDNFIFFYCIYSIWLTRYIPVIKERQYQQTLNTIVFILCIQKLESNKYPKMRVRASNYAGERCEIICEVSARQEMNEEAISALKDCGHVNGVNWLLEMGERIG